MWYMPFAGAGAGIASSAAGIAMSAVKDSAMQKKQFRYNLELQREAQRWQEYMSATAHQRAVADLRAAGLNPILTATGGQGASFSNASGSSVSAPSSSSSGGIVEGMNAASSLINADSSAKQVKIADKQADVAAKAQSSQAAVNAQDVKTKVSQSKMYDAQARMFDAQAKELGKTPVNRLGGDAFNSIKDFLNGPVFQNAASRVFMNEREFNKRVDSWFNQRKSQWHSRRNIFVHPLKDPSHREEVKFHNGFKR